MNLSKNVFKTIFFPYLVVFLAVFFIFSCKETPSIRTSPPLPAIQEPDFSITSIMILQAELINTRLRVKLRIENPNPFPVRLSAFSYELYGEGRFWADGNERNVFEVPASGIAEKDLYLVMNFIDMKRDLLDKVIEMDLVAYRFTGTVEIIAEDFPILSQSFNLEGRSEVSR